MKEIYMRNKSNTYINNARSHKGKKSNLLSHRDLGILVFAYTTGIPLSGERYSYFAREGREAVYSSIARLRKHGLIELKQMRYNGQFLRANVITRKGIQFMDSLGIKELSAKGGNWLPEDGYKNIPANVFISGDVN